MEYKVTTLMPSLGSNSAGCSTFCSTRKAVLDEVRSALAHLQLDESIVVEREQDIDMVRPSEMEVT